MWSLLLHVLSFLKSFKEKVDSQRGGAVVKKRLTVKALTKYLLFNQVLGKNIS